MVAARMTRLLGSVMAVWMLVLLYMGLNLYQLVDESRNAGSEIMRISEEVEQLKRENSKLRLERLDASAQIIGDKVKATNLLEEQSKRDQDTVLLVANKLDQANTKIKILERDLAECSAQTRESGFSKEFEIMRRRVENNIREMYFLISAQVTKLNRMMPETGKGGMLSMLEKFGEIQRMTAVDFEKLVSMDGARQRRDLLQSQLSETVQSRFIKLQNPKNCSLARKLLCTLDKGCGYGCQMHHALYCFIVAYATKRTLIIDSTGWRYSIKGWTSFFKPVSGTCLKLTGKPVAWANDHERHDEVHLPIVDALFPRPPQMPLSVPRDVIDRLSLFHGHPFIWWIGQIAKYLFRFQPEIQQEIDRKKKSWGFKSPIVGVQVRRTDKINVEAAYHSIEEYMYWVDLYYKELELSSPVDKKRVFLASDDPSVLPEAIKKFPDYEFISDSNVSKSAGLEQRYTDVSLHGVISDIEMLSDTDFLVCTFSSQVCRLAYEIMNNKHTDASRKFRSLDDVYYFGGQSEHRLRAIWPHTARSRDELDLQVGDLVGIAGNHWDGESLGRHHRTLKTGLFPAFKVEEDVDVVDFPSYDDK